jgi:similar to stage IV sporulation protein
MSWGKISGFWGHAQVRVTGSAPERFINLVAAAGIRLWAAKIDGQELQFNTDLISLKKLMEVRKNTGYIVEVQKKQGLLVFAGFLWQRKLLLAGFFCFWLCLYYLAGMIWTLDIDGMTSLEKSDVLDYVASLGLEKWANFRRLDLDAIEEQLYLRFPEIAWVAVERSGTKVSIRIVEK